MKIYVHNIVEPLSIQPGLYEEKHCDEIGNALGFDQHHYLSDINLDYWIWKNSAEDVIGKFQYRKWFLNAGGQKYEKDELERIFKEKDLMICMARTRNELGGHNQYNWYSYYHASFDLRLAIEIVCKKIPTLGKLFFEYLHRSEDLVYANLYVAKAGAIMSYYEWMFPILEEFCARSSFRHYPDKYQQRAPGYIAERLFSFWAMTIVPKDKIFLTSFNAAENAADKDLKLLRFSHPA